MSQAQLNTRKRFICHKTHVCHVLIYVYQTIIRLENKHRLFERCGWHLAHNSTTPYHNAQYSAAVYARWLDLGLSIDKQHCGIDNQLLK